MNLLNVTAPTLSAVIDGDFMTAQASVLLKQGKFAKVALLTGNNFDEGTAYAKQGISTDCEFEAWLASQGLNSDQVKSFRYCTLTILSWAFPPLTLARLPWCPMAFGSSERRLLLETINNMLAEDFSSSPTPVLDCQCTLTYGT
jgi:hypothetical protein